MNAILSAWLLILVSLGNLERQHLARTFEAAKKLQVGDSEQHVNATLGNPIAEYERYAGWSFLAIGAHPKQWCYGTYLNLDRILVTEPFVGVNPFPIHIRWFAYASDDLVIDWNEEGQVQRVAIPDVVYEPDERYDSVLEVLYLFSSYRTSSRRATVPLMNR